MPERDDEVYGLSEADVDDLYANVLGPRERYFSQGRVRSSGTRARIYKAHASGIAARSGATLGSASCNRVYVTSGTRAEASPAENETIYNNYTTAIDADIDIVCELIDGIWVVVGADC